MSAFASLLVRISANIDSFDRETKKAVERIRSVASAVSSVGQSLAVGVSLPLAGFATLALKASGDLDALKRGLEATAGSAGEAKRQFEQLKEVAKLPGLGLEEAVRGSTNLQAVGFSADKAKDILLQFGNALASVGRGREDLQEAIRQLGQMGARGQVTADNLKPLIERIPQIATIIKREFGADAIGAPAETFKRLGVSSQEFIEVLLRELGKLPRVTGGIKNEFENFRDASQQAFAAAGDALAPFATKFLQDFAAPALDKLKALAEGFRSLSPAIQSVIIQIGAMVAAGPLFLVFASNLLSNLANIKTAMLAAGIQTSVLSATLKGVGWVAIAAEIAVLANAFWGLREAEEAASKTSTDREKAALRFGAALSARGIQEATDALEKYKRALEDIKKPREAEGLGRILAPPSTATVEKESANALLELEQALRRVAVAYPPVTKVTTDAGHASAAAAANVKGLTEKFHAIPFTEKTREGEIFGAMFGILQSKHREFIQQLAEVRLGMRVWTDGQVADALRELPPVLDNSIDKLQDLAGFGKAAEKALTDAALNAKQAFLDFVANGFRPTEEVLERLGSGTVIGDLSGMFRKFGMDASDTFQKVAKSAHQEIRQVSLIVNDLAQELTNLAFEGGKFKDRMADAFESIGKALLRSAIETQLGRIAKLVTGLLSQVPGLGKVLGGIFGSSATGAVGSTVGSVGGTVAGQAAGSAVGGGASTAGAAASGGLTATLGTVFAGVGAAASVAGAIGTFRLEGTMNQVERNTAQIAIISREILQRGVNQFLAFLPAIHQRLQTVVDQGIGVYNAASDAGLRIAGGGSGGGSQVTINVYGSDPKETAAEVVAYLKLHGIVPA